MKSKGISDSLPLKQDSIRRFQDHVSSGKTAFFQKYEMDIVTGRREGPLNRWMKLWKSSIKL